MFDSLILTCEHGGNEIPEEYAHLFQNAAEVLQTHEGWDPGALELAQYLSKKLNAPLFYSTTSRLLIELNRTLDWPGSWSAYTKELFQKDKEDIVNRYYIPYREEVETVLRAYVEAGKKTLHLSVHSCTPVLNGVVRYMDLGILFDPDRKIEQDFADGWKDSLLNLDPHLDIKYNYPYLGIEDGFTTYLRKVFPNDLYAGIEVEINQKYPLYEPREKWEGLMAVIRESLRTFTRK